MGRHHNVDLSKTLGNTFRTVENTVKSMISHLLLPPLCLNTQCSIKAESVDSGLLTRVCVQIVPPLMSWVNCLNSLSCSAFICILGAIVVLASLDFLEGCIGGAWPTVKDLKVLTIPYNDVR